MRIAIREQLALLVILAVLLALAIVSIPTWIFVHNFVIDVESNGLSLTASLKASRVASELNLLQTICQTIATRILLQRALVDYYNGNATDPFTSAQSDLESAMNSGRLTGLFQARLYSRNVTGERFGLLNVTGSQVGNQATNIQLPYLTPDGRNVNLSDTEYGYPPSLYPNITYRDLGYPNPYEPSTPAVGAYAYPDVALSGNGGLILGPLAINETFALVSLTIPIRSLNVQNFIIGYLTLIASAKSVIDVQSSREGLDKTGIVLLIGPDRPSGRFNASLPPSNATYAPPRDTFADSSVRFILPPIAVPGQSDRHSKRQYGVGNFSDSFKVSQYPGLLDIYTDKTAKSTNGSKSIAKWSAKNEQGVPVSVGVARPQTSLVDWVVVVEKARSETNQPIHTLRNILLSCVFGTAGLAVILVFPCAHLGVMPIRRLKTATEKSIHPPGYDHDSTIDLGEDDGVSISGNSASRPKRSTMSEWRRKIDNWMKGRTATNSERSESQLRSFRIPGHVKMGKHYVTDELTELTGTFNEMTDELRQQYTSLDEKVAERTRELEISKRAAEAANESKTLFIANISHELKTPLNGIMGMCAVCMEENDINRIKQSLTTLYRSGDLLLHLLEDLLSFSKNQIGQQVNIEEREFSLGDIKSQVVSIFDKQVRENNINFTVSFVSADPEDLDQSNANGIGPTRGGPPGLGRLSDIYFWGDQHRILQVIINLVGNSLKFTPAGGKVQLRIRCLGEIERPGDESRTSSFSKSSSTKLRTGRSRASGSIQSTTSRSATNNSAAILKDGTALTINPLDPKATPHIHIRERSPTPPPTNARSYAFEFQIEDSGPGIPDHMQDKIFEPFVQGDLGLSKKFGGTGLGLSICSQLANLMGGSIALESTVGVGSIFTVQIPLRYVKERVPSSAASSIAALRPASVASTSAGRATDAIGGMAPTQPGNSGAKTLDDNAPRLVGLSAPFFVANSELNEDSPRLSYNAGADGLGRFRVLVADDNSTNIEVVSRMLKLEDISDVTVAKDGQEAYELVKQSMDKNQSFDVIFMDVQMPNVDGLQSTRLIRKIGYRAPIVALTAFSEESNVKECIESGMNEFLSKPIRRPALKQILKKFATIAEEPETMTTASTNGDDTARAPPNGVG